MKRGIVFVLLGLSLAACGADGEPGQPVSSDGSETVPVTGDVLVGMSVGTGGTRGYGALFLNRGPVSVGIGF